MKATRLRCGMFSVCGLGVALLGSLACSSPEYHIQVSMHYPGDASPANIEVTALPFDRDALRDSLAAASGEPRPRFPELEVELADYASPDVSGLDDSLAPWQAIHDSVRYLADSLMQDGPTRSARYVQAYARLREQYRRLAESSVDRDESIRERFGEHTDLAMRAAAAADALRAWEGEALAQFPELADSAVSTSGRDVRVATTDNHGDAEFALEPGEWWIVASWADPENPFREYYWNVAIVVRRFGTRTVPLFDGNGVDRWRY